MDSMILWDKSCIGEAAMLVLNGDYEEQNDFIVKALQGKCRMNYSGPEHFLTVDPVWKREFDRFVFIAGDSNQVAIHNENIEWRSNWHSSLKHGTRDRCMQRLGTPFSNQTLVDLQWKKNIKYWQPQAWTL